MMGAGVDVAALTGALIQMAQLVRDLGGSWYKASAEWADFPLKLNRLERRHKFWQSEFTNLGMMADTNLIETLREAQSLLEMEKARLERKSNKTSIGGAECRSKLSMTVFPGKAGLTIQRVIDAYDEISNLVRHEEEATSLLESRVLRHRFRQQYSLSINNDVRYVPLKITEDAVNFALNDLSGLNVVLLHGGPGKGKSTLVRHIAFDHKEKIEHSAFKQVVYLECGPQVTILAKQFELLQHLGGSSTALQEQRSCSDVLIPKQLSAILKDQKLLLVLDDVWEDEFLQQMIDLCGKEVKCLVTSQLGNLCHRMNCCTISIQIENIELEDAPKILARHTRLPTEHISDDVKRIMNKMITETQGNPLALASIATAIDSHRSDDIEEWERACEDFLRLLHSEDTALIYGKKYSRSFWSAMRLSIQSLGEDAQTLLILAHLCDGPSVPEEVVSILYKSVALDGNCTPFAKSRKELESRELLKITSQYLVGGYSRQERSWSVHSLHKLFIEDEFKDRKKSMFESLVGRFNKTESETQVAQEVKNNGKLAVDEGATIQIVLCALYFNRQFAEKAARAMPVPSGRFDHLRRNAIQPITRLLGKPVSERWPATAQALARQVFLSYICDNRLEGDAILQLLTLPISTLPVFSALREICTVEGYGWGHMSDALSEIIQFPGVLQQLINLLHEDDNPGVQELALHLLSQLIYTNAEAKAEIVHFPEACDKLVTLLSNKNHPGLLAEAANVIRNILRYMDDGTKRKLSATQGLVEGLLGLLADGTNMYAQGRAAATLIHLDPFKADGARLHSWYAYSQRGWARMLTGLNSEALADLDKALEENPLDHPTLSARWTVRARLGDFEGALADMESSMKSAAQVLQKSYVLQERGVVKRMIGDLFGALTDFNEGLDLKLELGGCKNYYKVLKQRGYLKYMMKDEDGARSDAELALKIRPSAVDMPGYELNCLGTSSIAYLDYKLK